MNAKRFLSRLVTIQDVSVMLQCCPRTLKSYRDKGRFPQPDIKEGRFIRWLPETISRWKKQNLEKSKN